MSGPNPEDCICEHQHASCTYCPSTEPSTGAVPDSSRSAMKILEEAAEEERQNRAYALEQCIEDLPEHTKHRRVLMVTTSVYEVWVEDDDDVGVERVVKRLNDSGDAYEYLGSNPTAIDGSFEVQVPQWYDADETKEAGPWPLCPEPGCERSNWLGSPYRESKWCQEHDPQIIEWRAKWAREDADRKAAREAAKA